MIGLIRKLFSFEKGLAEKNGLLKKRVEKLEASFNGEGKYFIRCLPEQEPVCEKKHAETNSE